MDLLLNFDWIKKSHRVCYCCQEFFLIEGSQLTKFCLSRNPYKIGVQQGYKSLSTSHKALIFRHFRQKYGFCLGRWITLLSYSFYLLISSQSFVNTGFPAFIHFFLKWLFSHTSCIFSCFFGHFGYKWVIFLIRKSLQNKAFMSYLCIFWGYKPVFIQFFLCFFQPGKFFLCIVIAGMRVNIKRHRYIWVSHQILQSLWIHSRICHICTIWRSTDVWSNQG